MKFGEKIPIKAEYKEAIKEIIDRQETAMFAFQTANEMAKKATDELWATIKATHPVLLGVEKLSFNKQNMEIICLSFENGQCDDENKCKAALDLIP